MKKSDLKDGMIVEYRNGILRMKIGEELRGIGGWMPLDDYKEDLSNSNEEVDIIRVYREKDSERWLEGAFDKDNLRLIWEREPEVDWDEVKIDAKILVSDDNEVWHKRCFAKYKDGKVCAWYNGTTSYTADGENSYNPWGYAKLYKEDEN